LKQALESKRTRESSCNRDVADTQRFVTEEIEKCSRLYCITDAQQMRVFFSEIRDGSFRVYYHNTNEEKEKRKIKA
jgi:hypothetical protein